MVIYENSIFSNILHVVTTSGLNIELIQKLS